MDAAGYERPSAHATVAALWFQAAREARAAVIAADGCFDLIVAEDAAGRRSAFVYTPVRAAHVVPVEAGARMMGVRVRPGYGAALTHVEAELVACARALNVEHGSLARLETLVASITECARPPALIAEFVACARAVGGQQRLGARRSGAAERELQRAAQRWLGLSPKQFLRIERAWAARDAIRAGTALAAVATEHGYADQAHLTRELRVLLGRTPGELRPVGNLQDEPAPNR